MEKLNNDINQLNEIRDQIVLLADDHSVNLAISDGVCYGTESIDLQRIIEIAESNCTFKFCTRRAYTMCSATDG